MTDTTATTDLTTDALIVDERGGVVIATISRRNRGNAIDATVVDGLNHVLDEVERRPRMLIITGGVDGMFVGGSDRSYLAGRRRHEGLLGPVVALFDRIERAPLPTIAAIDGPAIGGGAELAYACDLRLVTARSYFLQPEVRLGLIPGAGATWRLPRLVGDSVARQVTLAGRKLSGDEAVRLGLAMELLTPEELLPRALALAARMHEASRDALRLTKMCLNAPQVAHPHIDLVAQAQLFEHPDTQTRLEDAIRGT